MFTTNKIIDKNNFNFIILIYHCQEIVAFYCLTIQFPLLYVLIYYYTHYHQSIVLE